MMEIKSPCDGRNSQKSNFPAEVVLVVGSRRLTRAEINEYVCLMNTSKVNSTNTIFTQIFHLIF